MCFYHYYRWLRRLSLWFCFFSKIIVTGKHTHNNDSKRHWLPGLLSPVSMYDGGVSCVRAQLFLQPYVHIQRYPLRVVLFLTLGRQPVVLIVRVHPCIHASMHACLVLALFAVPPPLEFCPGVNTYRVRFNYRRNVAHSHPT